MRATTRKTALLGRDDELARVQNVLFNVRSEGSGAIVLLEGEAGIGKTRLLDELLTCAREKGFEVARGSAYELERDRPFGAVADALELVPDSADPERAAIGRLIGGGAEDAQAEAPQLRFRILDDIVSLVEQLASRAPFVLALEDLHWADSSALLVVDRLGRRLHQLRLALIGTRRPLPNRPELDSLMASAGHEGLRVQLPPLADSAVDALVNQLLGAPPGARLLATVADAAGNPFFLEELVEALRIDGAIELVDGRAELEDVLLPPSLRLTILTRLAFLSKETLETLRVASVLGASFSPNDLAAVLGRRGIDLVRLLGEAIEGGVLSEEGERLVFRHDLVRDAIYEDLPVPLRQELHRDAGRALAAARAPARQVATQLARGASAGDADTIEWLMRGAHEVFPTAPAIAADFLQRAQELAGEDYEQREHIDAELVRALLWSGRLRDAERIAHAFLARRPDPELAATVRYALARVLVYQGSVGDSIEQVEAALADPTLGDQLRARLLGDLALRRAVVLDLDQADAAAGEAQALADGIVDDLASSTARSARAWSLTLRGHYTEAVELATSALAYADRRPLEPVQVVQARLYLGRILLDVDELEQAGRTLEDARRLAEKLGAAYGVPLASALLALQRYEAGLWDDAAAEAETALILADEVQATIWKPTAYAVLALVAIHRDDLAGAERVVHDSEPWLDAPGGPRVGLDRLRLAHGLLAEAKGNRAAALGLLEQAWRENADAGALGDYRELAPELVRLASEEGRPELARELAETTARAASGEAPPSARIAALRCRVLLDDENAAGEAASAPDQRRPLDGALAQLDAGIALARVRRTDDAVRLLRAAATGFEALGAAREVARTDAALRELGVRRGRRGPRARPLTGWESMTQSEQRIADLVAEGLSNPEIARRLYVSRRTVETHVSHILRKLDLSSRVQLAAEAVRRSTVRS